MHGEVSNCSLVAPQLVSVFSIHVHVYAYNHITRGSNFLAQMENIVTNDGVASSTVLINAASSLERKLTGSIAQSFLKKLITSKWLCEIVSQKYFKLLVQT